MRHDYSIDTLRNSDGTYRPASANLIRGALRCGHTAHLQTERGIVAFRPFTLTESNLAGKIGERRRAMWPMDGIGQNWLVEFYAGGTREDLTEYRGQDERAALQFAFEALNGRSHNYRAGATCQWYANQARRDAVVLAVLGDEVLIEYLMPGSTNGRETSALVLCHASCTGLTQIRTYAHRKLPKRWVRAMHEQGTNDWEGLGQREAEPVPFPHVETWQCERCDRAHTNEFSLYCSECDADREENE